MAYNNISERQYEHLHVSDPGNEEVDETEQPIHDARARRMV